MLRGLGTKLSKFWFGKPVDLETDVNPVYDTYADSTCKNSYESNVDDSFCVNQDESFSDDETLLKKYHKADRIPELEASSMHAMAYEVNGYTSSPIGENLKQVNKQQYKGCQKGNDMVRDLPGTYIKVKPVKTTYNEQDDTPSNDDAIWDNSDTSDDPDDHVHLLNIQKNDEGKSATSGFVSDIEDDDSEPGSELEPERRPELEPDIRPEFEPELETNSFQRRNLGTRQSKLCHWNSVLGISDANVGKDKLPRETSPQRQFDNLKIRSANNAIFNFDGGNATLLAVDANERSSVKEKVKAQTKRVLETANDFGGFVKTEGYIATRKLVERESLAIVAGSGDGATTVLNQTLKELCGNNGPDDIGATPYVIYDMSDWEAVELEEPVVVIIYNADGKFLKDTLRRIEQVRKNKNEAKFILSIKSMENENDSIKLGKYKEYLIDLQSKYLISRKTMRSLAEAILKRVNVNVQYNMLSKAAEGEIALHDVEEIVRVANRRGFVREMIHFIKNCITEGPDYFKTPDPKIVENIEKLEREDHPGYYAILAIYDYKGEINEQRVEQIKRYSSPKQVKKSTDKTNSKPPIPEGSLLMKHVEAKKNKSKLGDNLLKGLHYLNGSILEETDKVYRYSSGKVKTSIQIVLAKIFPDDMLRSCDFSFVEQFVSPRLVKGGMSDNLFVAVESDSECKIQKAMIKRITDEILDSNISRCTNHPVFQESWFVDALIVYWTRNKHDTRNGVIKWKNLLWKVLQQTQKGLLPYSLVYFGQTLTFRLESLDGTTNTAEKILNLPIWKYKRSVKSKWSEWVKNQEKEALEYSIALNRYTTVSILTYAGTMLTEQLLRSSIQKGHEEIVKIFVQKACFTYNIWWNAWLYAYDIFQQENYTTIIFEQLTERTSKFKSEIRRQSLLQYAVSICDPNLTGILCKISEKNLNVDVNAVSENGKTALQMAIEIGDENIAEMLISSGARQINEGNVATLPVHEAAASGRENLLNILLTSEPTLLNIKDPEGNSPLHIACSCGNVSVVANLLVCDEIDIDMKNKKKQTAAHLASQNGHEDVLEMLIVNGANILEKDQQHETALSLAGKHNQYANVEILLKEYNKRGYSQDKLVLEKAIIQSDRKLLSMLIKYGYSFSVEENAHDSPLVIAVENDNHSIVQFLIENGADINQAIGGRQLILWAASESDLDMVRLLIRNKADIGAKDEKTLDTVIHYAVRANKADLAREVLSLPESSILLDLKNRDGDTALHIMCRDGSNSTLLDLLLEKGFSKKMYNRQCETPGRLLERRRYLAEKNGENEEWWNCTKLIKRFR